MQMGNKKCINNAVVMLNYKTYELTINAALKFNSYSSIDIIIIVDNCSPNNSFEMIKNALGNEEKIVILESPKNGGYSFGNNIGLSYLKEFFDVKNVIISNPDIEVDEISINKIIYNLDQSDDLALATGCIFTGGKKVSNQLWWHLTYNDMLLNQTLITYKLRKMLNKSNYGRYKKIGNMNIAEAVPGCFFIIKYKVFEKIGFFDEDFFMYSEENVLAYKLSQINKYAGVVDDAIIYHNHPAVVEKNFIKKLIPLLESYTLYQQKYLNCNKFQIFAYKIVFWIGEFERQFVNIIREVRKE